ncbi:SFRS15 [Lepeophtheirus salmonis]|uniref:SFRS15 n=1 Tax=Lepeophtheirus salmonis TaxID=72036 RepID=A0A7R8CC53_LEPSM|nr:uncharacterized protein LOC121122792 [Lepeophtheirus salmonis]CAB4054932.1 SFRS15 [Lepeophtheirus salmonis]CAF2765775.1 SFRS15 [Lepeophtheirus salmonis]
MFTDKNCSSRFLESNKSIFDMISIKDEETERRLSEDHEKYDLKRCSERGLGTRSEHPLRDSFVKESHEWGRRSRENELSRDLLTATRNRIAEQNGSRQPLINEQIITRRTEIPSLGRNNIPSLSSSTTYLEPSSLASHRNLSKKSYY